MKIELGQVYSFIQPGIRHSQEDARYPDVDLPSLGQHVFIVCDGVGGCSKGEVASRTVCDAMGNALQHYDCSKSISEKDLATALEIAYNALEKASEQARDMATTMALIAFHGSGVLVAHIGDSRIYHVRPGVGILYRSDDHSLVNAMIHAGKLSPDEAENHPKRHYITRSMSCVSSERDSASMLQITDVESGDYFMASTDGLLYEVSDKEIEDVLNLDIHDEEKVNRLKSLCRNSVDNSTVILIPVVEVEDKGVSQCELMKKTRGQCATIELPKNEHNAILQVCPRKSMWNKFKSMIKRRR